MADGAVLWHIPVSHYSEKARWALDYKGIEHRRHAAVPGAHMAIAAWLTRGAQRTLPVLELDGRRIGDSTAIVAALERHRPEPALYPADAAAREHALELEEFFDERLGPQIRLLAWHELIRDPKRIKELSAEVLPGPLRDSSAARAAAGLYASGFVRLRYRVAPQEAADRAREDVLAALDLLDAELEAGGGEYLAGDAFSVADLTAASLFYPLVTPPEGPRTPSPSEGFERFREPLRERPGYLWVEEMYRRHRTRAG